MKQLLMMLLVGFITFYCQDKEYTVNLDNVMQITTENCMYYEKGTRCVYFKSSGFFGKTVSARCDEGETDALFKKIREN